MKQKHLLIIAHPNKESFNHAILTTAVEGLKKKGHEVVVRDLYEIGFHPLISKDEYTGEYFKNGLSSDVQIEQNYLIWADVITFIYPILWTGLPAMMKGYIERIFTYGFAYKYKDGIQMGLLNGKKIVIINTQGKSFEAYEASGMQNALRLTSDKGIFEYCGMEVLYHIFFESVPSSDEATRKNWLEKIAEMASKS